MPDTTRSSGLTPRIGRTLAAWLLALSASLLCRPVPLLAQTAPGEGGKALYLKLYPNVIVNLKGRGDRFLMTTAAVRGSDEAGLAAAKHHMPALRHALIMELSTKQAAELSSPEGRKKAREQALTRIQKFLEKETGRKSIEDLYFTDLLIE